MNKKLFKFNKTSEKNGKNPLFTVAKFEILRQLKKPAFWIAILLIPVLMGGVFFISFLAGSDSAKTDFELDEDTVIAIVDEADILPAENPFSLFTTKEEGIAAIKNGSVDLFYYLPADFSETKKAEFYHISEGIRLFDMSGNALKEILMNVVSERIPEIDVLALTGNYEIEEIAYTSDGSDSNALGKAIIPLAILVIFFLFVCIFGNRFLMAVVEEKENRISEMILTSVSAKHLIIGKIIAMMALGVIQILSLILPMLAILFVYRDNPTVSSIISLIEISPTGIITNLILFVFSILLFSGFCTFIGVLVPTARDASQFIAPVIIGVMIPFYFIQTFMVSEPSFFVQFLTYFPLSAPTAMMLRNAFETLSPLEFYIGLAEIIICSVLVIQLTVKIFQKHAISFEIIKPKFLLKKQ